MKTVLPFLLLMTTLCAEVGIKGHLGLQSQAYLDHPERKHAENFSLSARLELDYSSGDFEAAALLNAQSDSRDVSGSEKNERTFVRLDELYATCHFENDKVTAGRNIRFWGALEVRNIVDGFNLQEFRNDPFTTDKVGAYNAEYTHYSENGGLSLIAKLYEENRPMAADPYVYYFFPPAASYDDTLQSERSRTRPSVYLLWSGSTQTEYPVDFAVILQNGYDSQRYFRAESLFPPRFKEHAYLVNKAMTHNTVVVGSTLLKLEALYADVIDNEEISDYMHLGLGLEHTVEGVLGYSSLGLIAEYYRYKTFEEGKYTDLELFEVFQNDLFVGMRWSFNDPEDSSVIGGVIADLEYDEQHYYVEFETRIADRFKLQLDYRYIEPSDDEQTAYRLLERHQRIGAAFGYYF